MLSRRRFAGTDRFRGGAGGSPRDRLSRLRVIRRRRRLDSDVPRFRRPVGDVTPVAVGDGAVAKANLFVDLRLELDEPRGGHPDARPSAGHLQEAEDDVALVPSLDEVLGLEEQRVPQSHRRPAPGQEVRDVDAAVKRARLGDLVALDRATGTGKRRTGSDRWTGSRNRKSEISTRSLVVSVAYHLKFSRTHPLQGDYFRSIQ